MAVTGVNWLVCYDIRDSRRLRRVHRCCRHWGMPLQRSVFACALKAEDLGVMIEELRSLMDEGEDDVRLYPIEDLANAIIQGTTRLPLMVESLIRMQQQGIVDDDREPEG
ncbi:CRISPR-associated endonuclease Cas2 [Halomonas campisalis]|uniref:CRISPR-associated endoribonuclease Cas2 n=1 Tax=Billgrantia campisalis TaxID=74661 RepID=A0ABS9PCB4_9GAMM|nr:CRISPR-associated endonuclease Cas2 [Halomonas campisalis]MCG6659403.1 CRISPR-associated endonuclease Cas2 [Halomonas campisalis]MDR5864005.1 CRISPR-associated endonuclease Cas2 [Halomonas campisalis]